MRFRQPTLLILLVIAVITLIPQSHALNAQADTDLAASPQLVYLPLIRSETSTATPTPPANDWLTYLNTLRGLANLPGVSENAIYSDGAYKHAKYMVKNNVIAHSEDSSKPFYTTEGNLAAAKSNVMVSSSMNTTDSDAIDMWMTGPFHGVGLIDPRLAQTGYGAYREADGGWQMAAALDVLRGLVSKPPASVTFPIVWPGNGKTSWLTSYDGNESPDPLTSCAGYSAPTGAPIYLQLGTGSITPNVTSATLTNGAGNLPVCVYTEATYVNPDSAQQSLGRNVLASRDAVVMLPKDPLTPGNYTVAMTVNGTTYSWSFTITATRPSRTTTYQDEFGIDTPPLPYSSGQDH